LDILGAALAIGVPDEEAGRTVDETTGATQCAASFASRCRPASGDASLAQVFTVQTEPSLGEL
jgi:hypothetical protein